MRLPVHAFLALLAALFVVAPASAGAATPGPTPLTGKLRQCVPARDATGGSALFKASMGQVPGATRMELRFDLEQAATPGAYTPVAVPKWGEWLAADPGRSGFVYKKRITGLVGPVSYRAQIRFRWLDDAGTVVRTTKRTTAACRQPDLRPNLELGDVTIAADRADPALATYWVVARNTGSGVAGPFAISLGTAGATSARSEVAGLARKSRSVVRVVGPTCTPGGTIDVSVDPENVVAEADESDNVRTVPCPLTGR